MLSTRRNTPNRSSYGENENRNNRRPQSTVGDLCEATRENARSKALDQAARYYLRMCGGVAAYERGDIQTLLDEAKA